MAAQADDLPKSAAPEAVHQRIRQLVLQVLERHPELLQAESESRQAESRAKEAKAGRLPQTSLSANAGSERQYIEQTGRTIHYALQQQLQIKGVLPLFDKGMEAQIRQRESIASRTDWSLTEVREQLVILTVELYVEVVRNVRLTELARETLKVHRAYVSQMKSIARIDLGRTADLPMAQSRVALAESVLVSRLGRLEAARVQWSAHTGLPSPDLITSQSDAKLQDLLPVQLPETLDLAVLQALDSSPQLQKSQADIAVAKSALAGARAVYAPKVNMEARASAGSDFGGVLGSQNSQYVGFVLDWTLPFSSARTYGNQAAEEAVVAANHMHESLAQKLKAKVETQWYAALASQHYLKALEEYADSAEQTVQAYREQFKIGRRSLLDVLNAENELFTARSNVVSSQQDIALGSWSLLGLRGLVQKELGL